MSWELAAYDTLRAYPAVVKALVGGSFDKVIDAVTPDPEVAEDAKALRHKILDEARAQAEREKQPAVEHESSNYDLYVATRKVGDIVHEVGRKISSRRDKLWMEDRRSQDANPYYNQTESGIFLDFSYGLPHSVWTPWGECSFRGSASTSGDLERRLTDGVMKRLEVTEFRPEINNEQGSFGPTYAIHKVDGVQLPDPVIRPRNAYLGYDEADKAWDAFKAQYRQQRGK